jgi:hypothetical protein
VPQGIAPAPLVDLGPCLRRHRPIHVGAGVQQEPHHRRIFAACGYEERGPAVRHGVWIGAPFEQETYGFNLALPGGVLESGPLSVVEVGKDEPDRGDGRGVQIDATRSQPADCGDVAGARGPDEVPVPIVSQIFV